MRNLQEKIFENSLVHYQNSANELLKEFYFYRPTDASEAFKKSRYLKPCDFWFFDRGFVAIECKYTKNDRLKNTVIKEHQIRSLHHFKNEGSKGYLIISLEFDSRTFKKAEASTTFAVDIEDYIRFKNNYRKSLFKDSPELWNGIYLEYKPGLQVFNLDPIVNKDYRIFS